MTKERQKIAVWSTLKVYRALGGVSPLYVEYPLPTFPSPFPPPHFPLPPGHLSIVSYFNHNHVTQGLRAGKSCRYKLLQNKILIACDYCQMK